MPQDPAQESVHIKIPEGISLVLASTSPRRRTLLTEAGIPHDAVDPGVDDGGLVRGLGTVEAWVMALAQLKAAAACERLRGRPDAVVLAADTVCEKNGEVIGQPRDERHAHEIVHAMTHGEHRVLTGVALLGPACGRRILRVDTARVIGPGLSENEIRAYVNSGSWRGKAGGYNLAERLDAGWEIVYEGDPTAIMGLPMRRLGGWINEFIGSPPRQFIGRSA